MEAEPKLEFALRDEAYTGLAYRLILSVELRVPVGSDLLLSLESAEVFLLIKANNSRGPRIPRGGSHR